MPKVMVTIPDELLPTIDEARGVGQSRSGWLTEAAQLRLSMSPQAVRAALAKAERDRAGVVPLFKGGKA